MLFKTSFLKFSFILKRIFTMLFLIFEDEKLNNENTFNKQNVNLKYFNSNLQHH